MQEVPQQRVLLERLFEFVSAPLKNGAILAGAGRGQ